nr:MAG: capsid protein [Cressdnaviricota sp.]
MVHHNLKMYSNRKLRRVKKRLFSSNKRQRLETAHDSAVIIGMPRSIPIIGDPSGIIRHEHFKMKSPRNFGYNAKLFRSALKDYQPSVYRFGDCLTNGNAAATADAGSYFMSGFKQAGPMIGAKSTDFVLSDTANCTVGKVVTSKAYGTLSITQSKGSEYCDHLFPFLVNINLNGQINTNNGVNPAGQIGYTGNAPIAGVFQSVGLMDMLDATVMTSAFGAAKPNIAVGDLSNGTNYGGLSIGASAYGAQPVAAECFFKHTAELRLHNTENFGCQFEVYVIQSKRPTGEPASFQMSQSGPTPLANYHSCLAAETQQTNAAAPIGYYDLINHPSMVKGFNQLWRIVDKKTILCGPGATVSVHTSVPWGQIKGELLQPIGCVADRGTYFIWVRAVSQLGYDATDGIYGNPPVKYLVQQFEKLTTLPVPPHFKKLFDNITNPHPATAVSGYNYLNPNTDAAMTGINTV